MIDTACQAGAQTAWDWLADLLTGLDLAPETRPVQRPLRGTMLKRRPKRAKGKRR